MAYPEKIGRYTIKAELGRGGMATVYHAFDPSFDREVAIKVLPREMMHDPQFRVRFEREIKMVAALEHPFIVPVYDVGDVDGQPYFVMRYMAGGSLSNLIEQGKVSIEDTARILERVAQGLAYSHKKGIIHRDLKPDNILFDENDNPFISDFGIAKLKEAGGGLTGSGVIGTPAYMSPEQAQGSGDIDSRTDVYGLGVIIYQMLSGQQPYSADTPMGVVVKHITEPVPEILKLLPDLPPEADAIIKTAMAKDREKRYPNTIDLAKAMNKLAFGKEGDLTFGTDTSLKSRIEKSPAQSPRVRTGVLIAGGVLLLAVFGVFILRNQLFAPDPLSVADAPISEAPASTAVHSPTATEQPAVSFAPFCAEDVAFPVPQARVTNMVCTAKRPYTSVTITEGSTFEVLHPDGTCRIEATSRGNHVLSCTGPDFLVMDLKVCNPPTLSSEDLSQCSADATFNSENQCCVPVPTEEAGCTVIEVRLRGCN
jgi:serine/threonine protein kinase